MPLHPSAGIRRRSASASLPSLVLLILLVFLPRRLARLAVLVFLLVRRAVVLAGAPLAVLPVAIVVSTARDAAVFVSITVPLL